MTTKPFSQKFTTVQGWEVTGNGDVGQAVARQFVANAQSMADQEAAWVARLRAAGIKASHPDDGWVRRDRNQVHFCYPQFNDGAGVGDLIVLGWGGDERDRQEARCVRLTGIASKFLTLTWWQFEPLHFNWLYMHPQSDSSISFTANGAAITPSEES